MKYELRINLINPINEKGIYDPKNAKPIDSISVSLYELKDLIFIKVLISHIEALLIRNGLLPED